MVSLDRQVQSAFLPGTEFHSTVDMSTYSCCCCALQNKIMYNEAVARGIPAELVGATDLWDTIEVKIALALLKAVVCPEAATEGLKRRVIGSSSDVKVPLTTGLGASHSVRGEVCFGRAHVS
jgi:hypothetical protein